MFKKILVPLDGSQIAAAVLPKVVQLAATTNAKVTLLHVCCSDSGEQIGETTPGVLKAVGAQEIRVSERFLAQTCKDLEAQGLQADWVCRAGVPAREIIAYAQNNDYDLIALGTHGKGEVAWNLGGVAERVAAHATVPVLLFRTLKLRPPMIKEKFGKVLKEAELYLAWTFPG
jgi:nucleotide-binding universal stress UspA family protein